MKKSELLSSLKEIMEIEDGELSEETNLRELEEFDSLAVLSLIAFLDENFQMQLTEDQLESITTVRSLMDLIGLERLE